ncbi:MFS general substrate transporter [Athelia psychrophila]|uniref:MFS general substrate transporter n=1 Tax=Athelia psychrophila TaxID=1759441 RepID=A0A166GY32_9AGAM|nr:MFS general substrate transporter [Fibularhizoctonia sp. CBS 109695]
MADAGDEWSQARRPLLPREPTIRSSEDLEASVATYKTADLTQLPDPQIFVLSCVKLAEPLLTSQLFPYINEFVRYLHIANDAKQVGFYSGLLESTFAIFQLMTIPGLAWLSGEYFAPPSAPICPHFSGTLTHDFFPPDRIGRRPIVLLSAAALGVTTFLFGFSTSLPMMLVNRAVAGCVAGDSAVAAAMVGELVSAAENAGSTLAIYALVWPAGYFLGPLLGGSLSHPAEKYKLLDIEFLRNWPYFLPGCITGLIALGGSLIAFLLLKEVMLTITHPSMRRQLIVVLFLVDPAHPAAALWDEAEASEEMYAPPESHSIRQILSNPAILALSGSGFALSILCRGFEIILVLYSFSPIDDGGLSFTTQRIGYLLSASAMLSIMFQFLFLPYLLRTFNTARMYNAAMCMFPFIFCLMPLLNVIARAGLDPTTGLIGPYATGLIWICIFLLLSMAALSNLAWVFTIVLAKETSPNPASLGTTNGVLYVSSSVAKIIGPALISSVYAVSGNSSFLGGFGWVPFMLLISLGGVWQSSKIVSTHRCRTE